MKIVINEEVCSSKGISFEEVLMILLVKTGVNIQELTTQMVANEALIEDSTGHYMVTQGWDDICCDALLSSETSLPKADRLDTLVTKLRSIFPAGKKEGTTSTYWKGNVRDIKLKLKKFFKLYGDQYTDDQIVQAARDYVASFNGNYTYMRALQYFIWKDEKKTNSEGIRYIEEVSDLATFLENAGEKNYDNNWNTTLR